MTERNSDWSGYRQDPTVTVEEPDGRWTTEAIIRLLRSRSCRQGDPWVGDDWRDDHGHTDCMVHGLAARRLEELDGAGDDIEWLIEKFTMLMNSEPPPRDEDWVGRLAQICQRWVKELRRD